MEKKNSILDILLENDSKYHSALTCYELYRHYLDHLHNSKLAFEWLIKADETIKEENEFDYFYFPIKMNIAFHYLFGVGVEQDPIKAFEYSEVAYDKKYDTLYSNFYLELLEPLIIANSENKFSSIFSEQLKKANKGSAFAMHFIGLCYEEGITVEQDMNEAISWYQKSAQNGLPIAQYKISIFYYKGQVIERNLTLSFRWILNAAKQGYYRAQGVLAERYRYGIGVEKDELAAFGWIKKASQQRPHRDYVEYQLGDYYKEGIGVEPDIIEATKFYISASNSGVNAAKNKQRELKNTYFTPLELVFSEKEPIEKNDIDIWDSEKMENIHWYMTNSAELLRLKLSEHSIKIPTEQDFELNPYLNDEVISEMENNNMCFSVSFDLNCLNFYKPGTVPLSYTFKDEYALDKDSDEDFDFLDEEEDLSEDYDDFLNDENSDNNESENLDTKI